MIFGGQPPGARYGARLFENDIVVSRAPGRAVATRHIDIGIKITKIQSKINNRKKTKQDVETVYA